MPEFTFVKDNVNKIKGKWTEQTKSRKTLILGVIIAGVLGLAFLIYSLTSTNYAVLFSGMEAAEAGEVMNYLNEQGVAAKIENDTTILVDSDVADSVRLDLSAQGYPKSGLNYDIFSQASSFGSTDMEKEVYLKFQIEQNIMQTISQLEKIDSATVMVNLAEDSQFALSAQGSTPASATVVLKTKAGQALSEEEANSVRNLVKTSVPNLEEDNITLVDSNMNMYETGDGLDGTSGATSTQLELKEETQNTLEEQIMQLLSPVFGQNNVTASVNVVLDFDSKVTSTVEFEPPIEGSEEGIIVSLMEMQEIINDGDTADTVGVDANGGAAPTYPEGATGDEAYYSSTREFNAEVNETKTQIENAKGEIQELSVSVIIDGDEEVEAVLGDVEELVANGIGVDPDNISVARMNFQANDDIEAAVAEQDEILARQQMMDIITAAIIGLAIAAVLIIILVIAKKKRRAKFEAELIEKQEEQKGGIDLLADEDISIDDISGGEETNGKKLQSNITKLVENNPEAVAQLLRNWLDDEFGR